MGSLAGPLGTTVGAAVGALAQELCVVVLDDIAQRALSPREEQRVADVAALAIEAIRERLLSETKRQDDFFDGDADSPSPAAEVFEGVLLSAKQEHEQLKLPYLANFYSNLVFADQVKRSEANYLLSIVESLTYTQLCLLSIVSQSNRFTLRNQALKPGAIHNGESLDIIQQSLYLFQRQLLFCYREEAPGQAHEVSIVIPDDAKLTTTGMRIASLCGLQQIPKEELIEVAFRW